MVQNARLAEQGGRAGKVLPPNFHPRTNFQFIVNKLYKTSDNKVLLIANLSIR